MPSTCRARGVAALVEQAAKSVKTSAGCLVTGGIARDAPVFCHGEVARASWETLLGSYV